MPAISMIVADDKPGWIHITHSIKKCAHEYKSIVAPIFKFNNGREELAQLYYFKQSYP